MTKAGAVFIPKERNIGDSHLPGVLGSFKARFCNVELQRRTRPKCCRRLIEIIKELASVTVAFTFRAFAIKALLHRQEEASMNKVILIDDPSSNAWLLHGKLQ
jgi:hypothetical protein